MMHTYHHGIVGQGVISTSYSMIYDLMGITLASVWVMTLHEVIFYYVADVIFTMRSLVFSAVPVNNVFVISVPYGVEWYSKCIHCINEIKYT